MPDRDVKTIRDLIYYQYAKIIVRRAFGAEDGKEAKKQSFISRQKIYSLALGYSVMESQSGLARHLQLTIKTFVNCLGVFALGKN
jgi:hypothetical protein